MTTLARESGVAAFGEELRRAREARGMDVEAVCQTTKVPVRHIRALESGDLDELPGGVFRRGFVRSYLGAVGLEESVWMKRFDETCRQTGANDLTNADWTAFAENVKANRRQLPGSAKAKGAGAGVILLAALLAGWCAWRVASHRRILPAPMTWTSAKSLSFNISR
jgi:cytoskeletal protein RodZ